MSLGRTSCKVKKHIKLNLEVMMEKHKIYLQAHKPFQTLVQHGHIYCSYQGAVWVPREKTSQCIHSCILSSKYMPLNCHPKQMKSLYEIQGEPTKLWKIRSSLILLLCRSEII